MQGTVCRQLFVVVPHAKPAHAVVGGSGAQQVSPARQTSPRLQEPHGIEMPHVTMFVSQTVVPHALASTEQHVPSLWHNPPVGQLPQGTSAPQLFVA